MCFLQVRHPPSGFLPICLSWRFLAPLALAGTQGCSIERNDADHAKDESGEDSEQREQGARMDLTVQPTGPLSAPIPRRPRARRRTARQRRATARLSAQAI